MPEFSERGFAQYVRDMPDGRGTEVNVYESSSEERAVWLGLKGEVLFFGPVSLREVPPSYRAADDGYLAAHLNERAALRVRDALTDFLDPDTRERRPWTMGTYLVPIETPRGPSRCRLAWAEQLKSSLRVVKATPEHVDVVGVPDSIRARFPEAARVPVGGATVIRLPRVALEARYEEA